MEGVSAEDEEEDEEGDEEEVEDDELEDDVDLFNNRRRLSSVREEVERRRRLGLPDHGRGLTKEYYMLDKYLSQDSIVDIVVRRRALGLEQLEELSSTSKIRLSALDKKHEDRLKRILAWKAAEDECNKEDVVVKVRRELLQKRKEARKMLDKQTRNRPRSRSRRRNRHSSQSEERRASLRTGLFEMDLDERRKTSESIKEAIEEFKMRQTKLVVEPETVVEADEPVRVPSDVFNNPRLFLERLREDKLRLAHEDASSHLDYLDHTEDDLIEASGPSIGSDKSGSSVRAGKRRSSSGSVGRLGHRRGRRRRETPSVASLNQTPFVNTLTPQEVFFNSVIATVDERLEEIRTGVPEEESFVDLKYPFRRLKIKASGSAQPGTPARFTPTPTAPPTPTTSRPPRRPRRSPSRRASTSSQTPAKRPKKS